MYLRYLKLLLLTNDGAFPNRRFCCLYMMDEPENRSDDGVIYWC